MRIRDLARELGISTGTVSRALNNRADVNPQTRMRVLQEAERLGYAPSHIARSLSQGTTNTIALMVRTVADRSAFDESFFMTIADGLQVALEDKGMDLILLACRNGQDQDAFLQRAVERRIADGYIISDTRPVDRRIDFLMQRDVPFVAFGRSMSGGAHSWVDMDFEGVASEAVERLFRFGHRRIALAKTQREFFGNIVFTEGVNQALERRGLPNDESLTFVVEHSEAGGYELGERIVNSPDPPTAVVLARDTLAIGLYRKLREVNLQPGRDISLIGFRDNPNTRFLNPKLTSFDVHARDLCKRLGEVLLEQIELPAAERSNARVQQLWPMALIEGASDGPLDQPATIRNPDPVG